MPLLDFSGTARAQLISLLKSDSEVHADFKNLFFDLQEIIRNYAGKQCDPERLVLGDIVVKPDEDVLIYSVASGISQIPRWNRFVNTRGNYDGIVIQGKVPDSLEKIIPNDEILRGLLYYLAINALARNPVEDEVTTVVSSKRP